MSEKKMSQKELKKPDAFQKAGVEASSWLQDHAQWVVGGVVAVLALGAIFASVNYVGSRKIRSSARELSSALSKLEKPIEGQSVAVPGKETFKSETERDEATVKAMDDFRKQHVGTPAAFTATFLAAQSYLRLNKYDEALTLFDEFLAGNSADEALRSVALEARGYALEGKGKLDEALAAFDRLEKENKSEFYKGLGAYHRSRILIQQSKKEEAAKLLSTVPATAPNTNAARWASERLAVLASEGIQVPPPSVPAGQDAGLAPN